MPLITNDIVTFGLLSIMLGVLFYARSLGGRWTKFFTFVPIVLLCYLIPSLLNSFGVISSEDSGLWDIAKNYFLPAALILLTLSIDLKAVWGLGPKALIMFFYGNRRHHYRRAAGDHDCWIIQPRNRRRQRSRCHLAGPGDAGWKLDRGRRKPDRHAGSLWL